MSLSFILYILYGSCVLRFGVFIMCVYGPSAWNKTGDDDELLKQRDKDDRPSYLSSDTGCEAVPKDCPLAVAAAAAVAWDGLVDEE